VAWEGGMPQQAQHSPPHTERSFHTHTHTHTPAQLWKYSSWPLAEPHQPGLLPYTALMPLAYAPQTAGSLQPGMTQDCME
jgi:hypothetical protein